MDNGALVLSFDYELSWGIANDPFCWEYSRDMSVVPDIVEKMLYLLETCNLNATWAVVGGISCENIHELKHLIDTKKFTGVKSPLNSRLFKERAQSDPQLFFAPWTIQKIIQSPGQELASHTFTHSYFENPQLQNDAIVADVRAMNKFTKAVGVPINCLVFPQNLVVSQYIDHNLNKQKLFYRSNPNSFFYRSGHKTPLGRFGKAIRLLNECTGNLNNEFTWLPGQLSYPASYMLRFNLPDIASRLTFKAILNRMTIAAKNKMVIHLWCHPHNLKAHPERSFEMLTALTDHFKNLNSRYGFESKNMGDLHEL